MIKYLKENIYIIEKILTESYSKDLLNKFINVLKNNNINYALIGGFAVSYYSKTARKISIDDIDIKIFSKNISEIQTIIKNNNFNIIKEHEFVGDYWIMIQEGNGTLDIAISDDDVSKYGIMNSERVYNYNIYNIHALIIDKLKAFRNKDKSDLVHLLYDKINDGAFINQLKELINIHPDKLYLKDNYKQIIDDLKNIPKELIFKLYQE